MTQLDKDKSTQTFLKWVLISTTVLGVLIRLLTPGWILIFFCLPLLIIVSLHTSIVWASIKKVPTTKPGYMYLILLSNLFFFLGCVLQVDGGDAPEYHVPLLWRVPFTIDSIWPDIFSAISMGSFVALVISWILLLVLSKNVLKKESISI